MSTLNTYAKMLGIDSEKILFTILDCDDELGLDLLHYRDNIGISNDLNSRRIRGLICDRLKETVVCSSFGYTPTVVLKTMPTAGVVKLTDKDGRIHEFETETAKFQPFFEGTVLRFFLHNGKVHCSTHRRLDAVNSKWGTSDKFLDLYKKYGGPDPETLFDMTKLYSTYTHVFLVTDPKLMVASKMPLSSGFVTFLGSIQQFKTPEESPYPAEYVDWNKSGSWLENTITAVAEMGKNPIIDFTSETNIGKVQIPATFDFDMALQVLFKGYYPSLKTEGISPLMLPGESVMCVYLTAEGPVSIKICSDSYQHRLDIVGNESNALYRAHQILDDTYFPREGADVYLDSYQPLACLTDSQFLTASNSGGFVVPDPSWTQPKASTLMDSSIPNARDLRLRNALAWLAFSKPILHQKEAFLLHKEFVEGRYEAIDYICSNQGPILTKAIEPRYAKDEAVWKRMRTIIEVGNQSTKDRIRRGEKTDSPGEFTRKNIRGLLMKETGCTLYRIVRVIRNQKKPIVVKPVGETYATVCGTKN